jgi:hypothetical protein
MKRGLLITLMNCAAVLTMSAGAHAQLDGTLFTQPEERAYLDYLREEFLRNNAERGFDIEEATVPVIPTAEAAAPTGPTEFSFGGIMARRDGSRSLWLNGALLAESALPAGMSLVGADRGTSLRITHEGKVYVLRPGQTVDLAAGNIMESYQRTPVTAAATQQDATESDAQLDTLENPRLQQQANDDDEADEAADDAP